MVNRFAISMLIFPNKLYCIKPWFFRNKTPPPPPPPFENLLLSHQTPVRFWFS